MSPELFWATQRGLIKNSARKHINKALMRVRPLLASSLYMRQNMASSYDVFTYDLALSANLRRELYNATSFLSRKEFSALSTCLVETHGRKSRQGIPFRAGIKSPLN